MTLLFFDGFQDAVLAPKPEWKTGAAWGSITTGRDGQANGAVTGAPSGRILSVTSSNISYVGFAAKLDAGAFGNLNCILVSYCTDVTTPTVQGKIVVNAAGYIEFRRASTNDLIAATTVHAPIRADEWHHYQIRQLLSTGGGTLIIRLDNTEVLNVPDLVTNWTGGATTQRGLRFVSPTGSGNITWDDLYYSDTSVPVLQGGRQNDVFLGDVRVASLFPSGAGSTTAWTPSSAPNWDAVNETPPNTADYVSAASTPAGTRDLYALTDLPSTANNVYAVRAHLYASKTDIGTANIKPVFRESSGTVTAQTAQAVPLAVGLLSGAMLPGKPSNPTGGTSVAMTPADVNGLQIGVDVG